MDYILFCIQEANFQTRSMFISYDLLIETVRGQHFLNILHKYSNYNEEIHGYLLYYNQDTTYECLKVISDLIYYAEGYFDDVDFDLNKVCNVLNKEDNHWVDSILCHPGSKGFNHIENFKKCMKMTEYQQRKINIVKGFLCLHNI